MDINDAHVPRKALIMSRLGSSLGYFLIFNDLLRLNSILYLFIYILNTIIYFFVYFYEFFMSFYLIFYI